MISCSHLTRRFDKHAAVDDISFEVANGAICAFLGANGAGKSTTLKMLAGLLVPTSGSVTVAGCDAVKRSLELKRRIGVLPENLGLFDDLTVEEHLHMTGPIYGLSRAETRSRTDQLLRALSLQHGRNTFASRCSHGMRKKTALAMALLPNPQVLLLDEPFEAIDPVTSKAIHDVMANVSKRGVTVFFTSHILSVVERLATQVVMIRSGKIVWDSPIEKLPQSLEDHYFDLAETPVIEPLAWLGVRQS
jgi:ABC-2 type transport system ATP-binding protein